MGFFDTTDSSGAVCVAGGTASIVGVSVVVAVVFVLMSSIGIVWIGAATGCGQSIGQFT